MEFSETTIFLVMSCKNFHVLFLVFLFELFRISFEKWFVNVQSWWWWWEFGNAKRFLSLSVSFFVLYLQLIWLNKIVSCCIANKRLSTDNQILWFFVFHGINHHAEKRKRVRNDEAMKSVRDSLYFWLKCWFHYDVFDIVSMH